MPKTARTRILVASGGRARWIERDREKDELVTLGELSPVRAPAHKGPAPVSFGHVAGMRHAAGDRDDSKRQRDAFAVQIAEALNRQDGRGEFDRLGLVAPPRLLKAVREHLSETTRAKIQFELPKDLTKHANHDLRTFLQHPQFV